MKKLINVLLAFTLLFGFTGCETAFDDVSTGFSPISEKKTDKQEQQEIKTEVQQKDKIVKQQEENKETTVEKQEDKKEKENSSANKINFEITPPLAGNTFTIRWVLSKQSIYNSGEYYSFDSDNQYTYTFVKAFPYIDGVGCYFLDSNILVAIDENFNMIWSGVKESLIMRWAYFESILDSTNPYLNVDPVEEYNKFTALVTLYSLNDYYIRDEYRNKLYTYDSNLGVEFDNCIEATARRDQEIVLDIKKMYNIGEELNKRIDSMLND